MLGPTAAVIGAVLTFKGFAIGLCQALGGISPGLVAGPFVDSSASPSRRQEVMGASEDVDASDMGCSYSLRDFGIAVNRVREGRSPASPSQLWSPRPYSNR